MITDPSRLVLVPQIAFLLTAAASPETSPATDPLRFFEGNTEMVSTTKIVMERPYITHSAGRGSIAKDGTLELVQHVSEEGRRQFDRVWHIRQTGPNRFGGTMSEASGPITIEKIGERYLFRFMLDGKLSAEEWLIPQSRTIARVVVTVRRFGLTVAHTQGWIRRLGSADSANSQVGSSGGSAKAG